MLLLTCQYSFPNTDYLAHRCNKDVLGETAIYSGVKEVASLCDSTVVTIFLWARGVHIGVFFCAFEEVFCFPLL